MTLRPHCGCAIFVWSLYPSSHYIFSVNHAHPKHSEIVVERNNEIDCHMFIIHNWSSFIWCTFVAMAECSDREDALQRISTEYSVGSISKSADDPTKQIKVKNNHVMPQQGSKSVPQEQAEIDAKLEPELEHCPEYKEESSSSKWQRRDSFSSCSSDSAVYCSSRHVHSDTVAQDVKKRLAAGQKDAEKKRQRNSSGSSDLSSGSDASSKDLPSCGVNIINFHVRENCSKEGFPKLTKNVSVGNEVTTESSCTITKSETFVKKKTTTTTCSSTFVEKPLTTERRQFHNLRTQIRKKTCSCDCSSSHTTYIFRQFKIQHETREKHHKIPRMPVCNKALPTQKQSSKALPQFPACSQALQDQKCSAVSQLPAGSAAFTGEDCSVKTVLEPSLRNSNVPSQALSAETIPQSIVCNTAARSVQNSPGNLHPDAVNAAGCVSEGSGKQRSKGRRRTEIDKLYDALHEIKWAKHMSPDNILSQIDVRRAASLSAYSSVNKVSSKTEPPSPASSVQKVLKPSQGRIEHNGNVFRHPQKVNVRNHNRVTGSVLKSRSPVMQNMQNASRNSLSRSHRAVRSSAVRSSPRNVSAHKFISASPSRNVSVHHQPSDTTSPSEAVERSTECNGIVKEDGALYLNEESSSSGDSVAVPSRVKRDANGREAAYGDSGENDAVLPEAGGPDKASLLCFPRSLNCTTPSQDNVTKSAVQVSGDQTVSNCHSAVQGDFVSYISNVSSEETLIICGPADLLGSAHQLREIESMINLAVEEGDDGLGMINHCVREEEVTTSETSAQNEVSSDCSSLPVLTMVSPTAEHPSSSDTPPVLEPYADQSCAEFACEAGRTVENLLKEVEETTESENQDFAAVESTSCSASEGPQEVFEDNDIVCEEPVKSGLDMATAVDVHGGFSSYPTSVRSTRDFTRILESEQHLVKKRIFKKYFKLAKKRLKKSRFQSHVRKQNSLMCRANDEVDRICTSISHPFFLFSEAQRDLQTAGTSVIDGRKVASGEKNFRVHFRTMDHMSFNNQRKFGIPGDSYFEAFSAERLACQSLNLMRRNLTRRAAFDSQTETRFTSHNGIAHTKRHWEVSSSETMSDDDDDDDDAEKSIRTAPEATKAIMPAEHSRKEDVNANSVQMSFKFTIHYKGITVNKNDSYTQVTMKLTRGNNVYLSVEALNELKDTLQSAGNDAGCQVLIVNGIGSSFCSGLDLKPLLGPKKNTASKEMAVAIKDFIEALAAFNKPLVSVVNGSAVGLGVTILAYSDVIIASDAATFHMPYCQLGYSPEGAATLMLPFVVGSTVAMDLLLRGRKISAHEACDYGLVSQVLTAKRLPLELVSRVKVLAENPNSAMETTKSMLRMHLCHRLSLALESETIMLPKQWLSESCQTALESAFQNGLLD